MIQAKFSLYGHTDQCVQLEYQLDDTYVSIIGLQRIDSALPIAGDDIFFGNHRDATHVCRATIRVWFISFWFSSFRIKSFRRASEDELCSLSESLPRFLLV